MQPFQMKKRICAVVNPGTGPIPETHQEHAEKNIPVLIQDAGLDLTQVEVHRMPEDDDFDGRYNYVLRLGNQTCSVLMPGLPLERVKFMGVDGQSAWDFPRLYVAGASWLWKFAINALRDQLAEDECGYGR